MKTAVLNTRRYLVALIAIIICGFIFSPLAKAQDKNQVVRLARLEIDAAQLENYKAMLKEEIEAAIQKEPGVLTLYAVYDKNKPTQVTVFEIYANAEAFAAHLETPHFKKYKTGTKEMVKSLELSDVTPIVLGKKGNKN